MTYSDRISPRAGDFMVVVVKGDCANDLSTDGLIYFLPHLDANATYKDRRILAHTR